MNINESILREKVDPALTRETIGVLASQAVGEAVRCRDIEQLSGGTINRVIRARFTNYPDLVFKIAVGESKITVEHEFEVLKYFARHTSFPMPHPLLFDSSEALIPGAVLVMPRLPGRLYSEVANELTREQKKDLARQMAQMVADLGRCTRVGFGDPCLPATKRQVTWAEFWMPRFDYWFTRTREKKLMPKSFFARVDTVCPAFDELLDIGRKGTLTHYDLWGGNVLVDLKNGRPIISGFIDPHGYLADYAHEIAYMELFELADEHFLRVYEEKHPLGDDYPVRKALYNLKMNLLHFDLYPHRERFRMGAEDCLKTLEDTLGSV